VASARRKGEVAILHCAHCAWSTEVALDATADSMVVACAHCGQSIYWHRCVQCGLCYLGSADPACPSCDDSALDDLEFA
jgi:hypothetical protein